MHARASIRRHAAGGVLALLLFALIAAIAAPQAADAAEAMTQDRINKANDAYNDADAALEFITMSDTELSGKTVDDAYNISIPWYREIAQWAKDKHFNIQAVMDNGDVVGGNEGDNTDARVGNWYRAVDRVFSEAFPDAKILLAQGNHDYADWMGKILDVNHKKDGQYDGKWFYPRSEDNYVGNYHVKIGGFDFITLDYNGAEVFGYANQRNGYQDFLKKTLADIKAAKDYDPAKPIFIQVHSGYAGTTLGGPFHADYDTVGPDLQTILKDYPQAFVGSAHTHFLVQPETSIYQKDFTFFENGAMSYPYQDVPGDFLEGGYFPTTGDTTQANRTPERTCNFFTVLKDGTVVIRRFDVSRRRWIGMPWTVKPSEGKAGFKYTDAKRSKVAPWWENGAKVTADGQTETGATIGFTQAVDDELVHYYKVELTDQDGKPVDFQARQIPDFGADTKPKAVKGSFRAFSRFYVTPDDMRFELSGLEAGRTYHVKVTAYDSFENASATPLEGNFTTMAPEELPAYPGGETSLPDNINDGLFMDMSFEGNLTDAKDAAAKATAHGNTSYVAGRDATSGKALRIGGTNNDYVNLGQREQWNLGTDKNLTINFWINVTSESGYAAILSNKDWDHYYLKGINITPESSNTSKLEFTLGDGTNGVYVTGDVPDYNGSGWHMMSVTVDRTKQLASTYFDGQRVMQKDISTVGDMTSGLDMMLGTDASKKYGTIGFDIDDLQMWDRALSDSDIAALKAHSGDSTAGYQALQTAVAYAQDVQARVKAYEQAGGTVEADDVKKLDEAVKAAADAKDPKAAYDALKAAVTAVEEQLPAVSDALDLASYRTGADPAAWTHPEQDGYAFTGWFRDKAMTRPVGAGETQGKAYPRFTKVDALAAFLGGSLRKEDDVKTSIGLRFGYRVALPAGCALDTAGGTGWNYWVNEDGLRLQLFPKKLAYANEKVDGADTVRTNLVLTDVPAAQYGTDLHASFTVAYTTPDGTRVTVNRGTDTRSVNQVAQGIVKDTTGTFSAADKTYAQSILDVNGKKEA